MAKLRHNLLEFEPDAFEVHIALPAGFEVVGLFCNHEQESVLLSKGQRKITSANVVVVKYDPGAEWVWHRFYFLRLNAEYEFGCEPEHLGTFQNMHDPLGLRIMYRVPLSPDELAELGPVERGRPDVHAAPPSGT